MNYKKNILLFLIFSYFILGLFLSINTGISHDEFHEQLNWSKNFDAIKSFFGEGSYEFLNSYSDKYHGIAFHYLAQPIQLLTKNFISNITNATDFGSLLLSKHLVIFLIFFLSGVCFYFLNYELSNSKIFAFISSTLYLTYPYLFGHSLINPKDIPFLSFWIFSTFFLFKIIKRLYFDKRISFFYIISISFFSAFLLSIRISGALIFVQFFIGIIVLLHSKRINYLKFIKVNFQNLIIFIILFLFFLYILNPVLWLNPFELINSIKYMSKYFNDVCTLTLGECMKSLDLPTKYYFIWIFFKLPIISIFGLLIYPIVEKKIYNNNFSSIIFTTLILTVLIILLILIFKKVAIYDEIRHILFLVPLLLIISFYNIFVYNKKIFYFLSFVSFLIFTFDNIKLYPYQYTWLNSFAKFYDIQKNFEIDYWGVSNKNLQNKIILFTNIKNIDKNNMCIYGDAYSDVFLLNEGFKCFKTYSQIDAKNLRPFIAYQNLRNLKRNDPNDCELIGDDFYRYFLSKQKIVTGKIWYCY